LLSQTLTKRERIDSLDNVEDGVFQWSKQTQKSQGVGDVEASNENDDEAEEEWIVDQGAGDVHELVESEQQYDQDQDDRCVLLRSCLFLLLIPFSGVFSCKKRMKVLLECEWLGSKPPQFAC